MAKYRPISPNEFADTCWTPFMDYRFVEHETVMPLMVTELAKAQQTLPIAFIKVKEKVLPVAVLGLGQQKNLFVRPDNGLWATGYVPASIRSYPFRLAKGPEDRMVLCIDEESGLLGDTGTPLFEEGKPSERVQQIMTFLQSIEQARDLTESIGALIAKHDLLKPWALKVVVDGEEKPVVGLFHIDEQKLQALSGEALEELNRGQALGVIYAQLFSMQNFAVIHALVKAHEDAAQAMQSLQQDDGELDLEFLNEDVIRF